MKSYILFFLLFICVSGYSQTSLNNFKYVLVPEKFAFLKQNDQYRLNSQTKSLLQENGFTAYFDNSELPTELANNKCNTLNAEVLERKSMFSSRLTLLLKDCKGNVIFKSKEGNSREKDFELSYSLALQDAFSSLKDAKYTYQPLPATTEQSPAPVKSVDPAPAAKVVVAATTVVSPAAGTLYAQPIANGYQLIDTTPKTILRMYKTSVSDYFIADNGSSNGIVFKKGESWVFEYYKDGKLLAENLSIKF